MSEQPRTCRTCSVRPGCGWVVELSPPTTCTDTPIPPVRFRSPSPHMMSFINPLRRAAWRGNGVALKRFMTSSAPRPIARSARDPSVTNWFAKKPLGTMSFERFSSSDSTDKDAEAANDASADGSSASSEIEFPSDEKSEIDVDDIAFPEHVAAPSFYEDEYRNYRPITKKEVGDYVSKEELEKLRSLEQKELYKLYERMRNPSDDLNEALNKAIMPRHLYPPLEDAITVNEMIRFGSHTKVTSGGRINSFSALVVLGTGKGTAGFGYGKAEKAQNSIVKAQADAMKNLVSIDRFEDRTIAYDITTNFRMSKISMRSKEKGYGIRANYIVRIVCQAFGIDDLSAKTHGSRDLHNMIRSVFKGLMSHRHPEEQARMLGKKIFSKRKLYQSRKNDGSHQV
eukprot:TRINITY_DN4135_c0_g1_i1.p1 TRINITY_DN4135_c0_g1~~TRINITY_DN4135_c0_g1_i1.p1  ORF type:complete len:398 (-),score=71.42 TRINITY_DN4135_c0_g1_i1:906-2099(-)